MRIYYCPDGSTAAVDPTISFINVTTTHLHGDGARSPSHVRTLCEITRWPHALGLSPFGDGERPIRALLTLAHGPRYLHPAHHLGHRIFCLT